MRPREALVDRRRLAREEGRRAVDVAPDRCGVPADGPVGDDASDEERESAGDVACGRAGPDGAVGGAGLRSSG